jgi:hypothetical protein
MGTRLMLCSISEMQRRHSYYPFWYALHISAVIDENPIKSLFVVVYLVFNVINISVIKSMIFGGTSRYNGMIFHVARRYNVILQRTPHFLITPHQKSLRR